MGCSSCEESLKAEISEKDEEELTEQEKAIMEGDAEAPEAYGPLSDYDGTFCQFCYRIGHVIALTLGVGTLYLGYYYGLQPGYSVAFTAAIYAPAVLSVLYYGRFPVLGAVFGPMVEKVAAKHFNIYLTTKAEQKYGQIADWYDGENNPTDPHDTFVTDGTEMHVVATSWAAEQCAPPDIDGALVRVEVEQTPMGPQIVDYHPWDPDVNMFPNTQYHVNPKAPTVCHGQEGQPVTTMSFSELMEEPQSGGVS